MKIFGLKKNQILPATIEKIKVILSKNGSMVPLDEGLQWVNVRTLCYPDIFKTVVYAKPCHTQNQKHIRALQNIYNEAFCQNSHQL